MALDDSTVLYVTSISSGAFKSTDGGTSFSAIGVGVLPFDTRDVVIDPSNSSIVYIGTEDGVFKSTNAGASFSLVGSSEILGTALHFPPDAPGTLLAASRPSVPSGFGIADSIHQTTNGGATWEVVPFLHTRARDLAGPMTRLFAASESRGLYRSLDGGTSWSEANAGLGGAEIESLTADPVAKQTVYATGFGGVFKSTDGGESWSRSEDGLEAAIATTARALRVVVDPQAPETLYTAIRLGIYRSLDGGGSWSQIFDGTQGSFEMFCVNPVNSSDLLAGAFGTVLWRSLDGGASWNPSTTGLPVANNQLRGLWRDPSNPAVLYLQLV